MASQLARGASSLSVASLARGNSSASNFSRVNSNSALQIPVRSSTRSDSLNKPSDNRPGSRGTSPRPDSRGSSRSPSQSPSPRPDSRGNSPPGSRPNSPPGSKNNSPRPDGKNLRPSGRKNTRKSTVQPTRKRGGEDIWEFRTYQSRRWGHTLKQKGGSNVNAVKNLTATLKDARAASQISLRRTAVEALMPAGSVGNRGALEAQLKALGDHDDSVRRTAMKALQKAAGGKRAERGGAVAETLADMLPDFSKSDDISVRRAAANALAKLAPNGDQQLADIALSWVEDEDATVRKWAMQALGVSGSGQKVLAALSEGLYDQDWRVNKAAAQALEKYSTNNKKAKDTDLSPKSEFSPKCSGLDQVSIQDFSSTLGSTARSLGSRSKSNISLRSAVSLDATTPAEALAESCRSGFLRGFPRANAVIALGKVGKAEKSDKSITSLVADQLNDVDIEVRRAAVSALSDLAPGDRSSAVRVTANQLVSSDFRVRESAGLALASVANKNGDALATSLAAATLEGDDWRGRRGAAVALRRLGELDDGNARDAVIAVLVPRLEHPDWSIRRKAAQALGVVAKGVGDIRCIKLLKSLSRDPDQEVRIAVVEALPGAAPPTKCKEAVEMAATFARDSNPRIRKAALLALQELASADRSRSRVAVHAVNDCIQDKVEEVRLTAERVMQSIAPGRRTAIDDLAKRLGDPDDETRKAAANAFAGVGPERRDRSLKRLVPLLRHKDSGVRQAACEAMQGMTNQEEAAVVAAAANVVAKFRRRFEMPRGHALCEEEGDEEEEDGTSNAGSLGKSSNASMKLPEAKQPQLRANMTEALLRGDLKGATMLRKEEQEIIEEEAQLKEDTDTESELSESDTDVEEEEGEEENEDEHHPW